MGENYHPFLQLCPDVRDSKTIEQVHECDGEGKYEAEKQEKLADEGKGVGGVGLDVTVVNLPDQHCHHLEKHSSRREVRRGSKNQSKGNPEDGQKRNVEDKVLDEGDLDPDEHEVGGGDGGVDAKGVGKKVETGNREKES